MFSQPSRPVFARQSKTRKFGRTFERLDEHSAESLCCRELGKVNVDCKFRLSESLWGVLGEARRPAGILYMDLTFHQPKSCKLSSATVLVTLQEDESESPKSYKSPVGYPEITTGSLRVDKFGPKKITGEQKTKKITSRINLTPTVNVMGIGAGGLGKDTEEVRIYASRWIFEGKMIAGERVPNGPKSSKYKTLRWDLSENELDLGVEHSNEFHTGFSFEHEKRPCYLKVEISGKLQKMRHQLKHRLKFPPSNRKDQGSALTWINLEKTDQFKTRLDRIANGLSRDLEWKNYAEIPVQLPDALPATFYEEPAVNQVGESPSAPEITRRERISSVSISQEPATLTSALPVGLLDKERTSLDPMVINLARGSIVFGGPAGVRQKIDQEPTLALQHSSVAFRSSAVGRQSIDPPGVQYQDKSSPAFQLGESEDADGRQTALLPILMLMQFLANFLNYFAQNSPFAGDSPDKKMKFDGETAG